MTDQLTPEDKQLLLREARRALESGVLGGKLPPLDQASLSPRLLAHGAAFVTLTENGMLRGCIGALEAYQPLVEDVRAHAVDAALNDYRFPPVQASELQAIQIEVSRLTAPVRLEYSCADDLVARLRPGVDGVILKDGARRATFLPQVWEQLPEVDDFLGHLCMKMGAAPDLWRHKQLDVQVYQVEEFHE